MIVAANFVRLLASIVCLLVVSFQTVAEPAEEVVQLSDAETLVWMTDQLRSIDHPMEIRYRFERTGTFGDGFSDSVRFIVDAVHDDGMKSAQLEFLTGDRAFDIDPVASTNVNPVLKIYLQGDVYEMNRLTDPEGKSKERWRYFQRRIKFALAETASVEDVVITFEGEDYAAKKIQFAPYVNDPKRKLFKRFADKTYTIIVAEALPGYVYSIGTVISGEPTDVFPLIKEHLQLIEIKAL